MRQQSISTDNSWNARPATVEHRFPVPARPASTAQQTEIAGSRLDLKAFAAAHRLKGFRLDECDDPEIVGRFGHLFEWSPSIFGVVLEGAGTLALMNRRREGLKAGMKLALECDFGESILHFDPRNREQARTAIKIAGIRRKRKARPSDLRNLSLILEKRGAKVPQEAISGGKKATFSPGGIVRYQEGLTDGF